MPAKTLKATAGESAPPGVRTVTCAVVGDWIKSAETTARSCPLLMKQLASSRVGGGPGVSPGQASRFPLQRMVDPPRKLVPSTTKLKLAEPANARGGARPLMGVVGLKMAATAFAFLLLSALAVAVTVTVLGLGIVAGAV